MAISLCAVLLAVASTLSGFPNPGACPSVQAVPLEPVSEIQCKGECTIQGVYQDGRIYISDKLSPHKYYGRGVLVHELMHYMQDRAGMMPVTSCEARVALEKQAYHVQQLYLTLHGKKLAGGIYIRPCEE